MVASDGIVLLRGGPRCVWILRARNHLSPNMVSSPDLEQESKATDQRGSFSYIDRWTVPEKLPKSSEMSTLLHYYRLSKARRCTEFFRALQIPFRNFIIS